MKTILSQLTILIQGRKLTDNIFFIDKCPDQPELIGAKCRYMSNGKQGLEFLNLTNNSVELVDPNLKCEIKER